MWSGDRRSILAATSGLILPLAGCAGIQDGVSQDQSNNDNSEQSTDTEEENTEEENTEEENTEEENTEESTEPSWEDIDVSLDYDYTDSDTERWALTNNSSSTLQMASVDREDYGRDLFVTFAIPPGGTRKFGSRGGDPGTFLDEDGSWFTNQNKDITQQVDAASQPIGITKSSSQAKLDYQIPNPTNIATEDVRQAKMESDLNKAPGRRIDHDLDVNEDSISYSSDWPFWSYDLDITLDGTSTSESFTWSTIPPQIDIDVAGEIGDIELTLTAQSSTPVINSAIYVIGSGPSLGGGRLIDNVDWHAIYRDEARVTDDPETTALITDTVGEDRIGRSRDVNIPYNPGIDYPIDENDDEIIVGIASIAGDKRGFPVTNTKVPLADLV